MFHFNCVKFSFTKMSLKCKKKNFTPQIFKSCCQKSADKITTNSPVPVSVFKCTSDPKKNYKIVISELQRCIIRAAFYCDRNKDGICSLI